MRLRAATASLALAAVAAGCGGSVTESGVRPWPSPQAQDEARISHAFSTFFAGDTSVHTRARLLQDAAALRPALRRLSAQDSWQGTSVKVEHVVLADASHAIVTYSLIRHAKAILAHQHGQAVLVDGSWKVATPSFCVILALRGSAPVPCPSPPANDA